MSNQEIVLGIVADQLAKINTRRVKLDMEGLTPVAVYADVKNGRGPRGVKGEVMARLPIIGSRELSRLGDELDRERAALVVVFTVGGEINGVGFTDVTIWINDGQVSLPTLFSGTDKARHTLYMLGRAVRDELAVVGDVLMDAVWADHLDGVISRALDYRVYLNAVITAATAQETAQETAQV